MIDYDGNGFIPAEGGSYNSVDIHRESYERARSLLEKFAAVPAHFEKTSSEHGLSTFRFWVSLEHGPRVLFAKDEKPTSQTPKLAHQVKVQAHLQQVNSEQERNLGRKWTDEIALPLKIGQVSPQVINDQDSWLLVRLIRHTDSKFEFSGVRIPKRDYQEWRKHEDAKVKIEMRQSL